jgi:hypothetical protein
MQSKTPLNVTLIGLLQCVVRFMIVAVGSTALTR